MSPFVQPQIAIVGGGPAGFMLGALLQKSNVPFTLFEFREQPDDAEADEPAGTLDLHEDSGLLAIKEAGLYEKFLSMKADCTEEMIITDKSATVIHHDIGSNESRPEISRNKLRQLLCSSIPSGNIKWGYKLKTAKKIATDGHERTELDFGTKGRFTFDFVVGADGAWSKTRALLTSAKPVYSGHHNLTLLLRNVNTKHPKISQMIGSGTFMALADHHGVCAQRATQDSARIYIFTSAPDENYSITSGLKGMTYSEAKRFLMGPESPISGWSADIRELVAEACQDEAKTDSSKKLDIVALYRLPPGTTWSHVPGVTIIGDAAHVLNPGAGDGANTGMRDAVGVARALTAAWNSDLADRSSLLSEAIEESERDMFERAAQSARGTLWVNHLMFGDENGAKALASMFTTEQYDAPADFVM